jgi:hypothetical protein
MTTIPTVMAGKVLSGVLSQPEMVGGNSQESRRFVGTPLGHRRGEQRTKSGRRLNVQDSAKHGTRRAHEKG